MLYSSHAENTGSIPVGDARFCSALAKHQTNFSTISLLCVLNRPGISPDVDGQIGQKMALISSGHCTA